MSFKLLDCFCGMGGVSDGFTLEGFDVTGIDIVDAVGKLGYKHRFIQADMATLKGENFRGYDVVWGSPPCRDFSELARMGKGSIRKNGSLMKWKIPPSPEHGLELVKCFLRFADEAKPRFWILENVANLANYLDLKPRAINTKIYGGKRHVFYGNFPSFLIPTTKREVSHMDTKGGKLRAWIRARIPLACSRAFARACREQLLEVGV